MAIRISKNYRRFDSLVFSCLRVNKTQARRFARRMVYIRHILTSIKCQTCQAALSYDVWLEVKLANIDGKHSFCTLALAMHNDMSLTFVRASAGGFVQLSTAYRRSHRRELLLFGFDPLSDVWNDSFPTHYSDFLLILRALLCLLWLGSASLQTTRRDGQNVDKIWKVLTFPGEFPSRGNIYIIRSSRISEKELSLAFQQVREAGQTSCRGIAGHILCMASFHFESNEIANDCVNKLIIVLKTSCCSVSSFRAGIGLEGGTWGFLNFSRVARECFSVSSFFLMFMAAFDFFSLR